ncbi:DUF3558 domain-containing protein [Amycolatopsis minnesotensis]|uniref:DUF3558 domain-containing protein n=1 Tax=Amycolatopsis minnesotensis TaxID=337894 RepID=A0ABN2RM43_9PSEU
MTRKAALVGLLGTLTVSVLCSCSNGSATNPFDSGVPKSSPSSTSTGSAPAGGRTPGSSAPRVTTPLNTGKFTDKPCDSLSESQLQKFSVTKRNGPRTDGDGASCSWSFGANGETYAGLTYATIRNDGLSRIYDQHQANMWPDGYFEPTEIADYPAAFNSPKNERPKNCGISVGVTDELMFTVFAIEAHNQDACKAAKNLANAVVETIKAGQ